MINGGTKKKGYRLDIGNKEVKIKEHVRNSTCLEHDND